MVKYEWDEAKRATNLAKHHVDIATIISFNWETALVWEDTRFDYGEVRFSAYGYIGTRLHFVAFTLRNRTRRIISLRKANDREVRAYEQQIPDRPSDA